MCLPISITLCFRPLKNIGNQFFEQIKAAVELKKLYTIKPLKTTSD